MHKEVFHLLDNDLYKCTMQQAVLALYPDAVAEYRFVNRGKQRFNSNFVDRLGGLIDELCDTSQVSVYRDPFYNLPFLRPWYAEYVKNYKYKKAEIVKLGLTNDNNLDLVIKGPWRSTILWEVKLMHLVSELYFETMDTNWGYGSQVEQLQKKAKILESVGCKYADFGTRRRRSYRSQKIAVETLKEFEGFVGTSNILLALENGVRPIGTMAHEWIQGISALESINHANRFMLERWAQVYGGDLGIALTDTFGSDSFFRDFSTGLAKLFDGVRHDSGSPIRFIDKAIMRYRHLNINPMEKTIVFSDGLDPETCVEIKRYCDKSGIKCSFGIGTNLTNDFNTPALNIVIKLFSLNNEPVVKLSDVPGKATGETQAIEAVKYIYGLNK